MQMFSFIKKVWSGVVFTKSGAVFKHFLGGIQRLKKGVEVGNFKKYFLISKYKIVIFFLILIVVFFT